MKIRIIAVMVAAVLMSTVTFAAKTDAKVDKAAETKSKAGLSTQMEKVSYAIGTQIGGNFKQSEIDINIDALVKGIADALKGGDLALTQEEMQATMMAFQQQMMAKMQAKAEKAAEAGKKFLEDNKKKDGIKTLPSGLQYKVVKEGKGNTPKPTDRVKVNYRGTLVDGTEFDSSYKRGEPATFGVTQVIKGWTEALQLMKEGAKWELYIPGDLAYGQRGSGQLIGPNATLIFEVELLGIEEPVAPKSAPEKK